MKKSKKVKILLLSILSAMGIPYILKGTNTLYPLSNSILAVILLIGIYVLMKYVYEKTDIRARRTGLLFGSLFSIWLVIGANIINTDSTQIMMTKTWLKVVAVLPLMAGVITLVITYLSKNQIELLNVENKKCSLQVFWVVWAIIFAVWMLTFLATYPGIYGYDSIFQVDSYAKHSVNTHHPIIHTYLLGFFVITIGQKMLGSVDTGMALYSIFQMLCMSAIFSCLYTTYIRKRVRRVWAIVSILLYAVLPVNALMAISSTKDVLFAGLFSLMIMLLLMTVEKSERLENWKFCLILIVVSEICIWFRNQEIYVFGLGMLVSILALKKYWKRLLMILLTVVVGYGIYSGPVTNLVAHKNGDSINEMMSIPCVQLSRSMAYNSDELTDEEKQLIEKYIPNFGVYESIEAISDGMKNTFQSDLFKDNPKEFIGLWLKVGKEHPITYIDAFARITIGWWYPDMNYRDSKAYHPYWEYDSTGQDGRFQDYILVQRKPVAGLKKLTSFLEKLSYDNSYQKAPIISMLFSSGCMVWGVFIYCATVIYQKRYKHLLVAVFVLALWLTLLVGPVVLYRYAYPIAVIEPLLFAALCSSVKKDSIQEEISNG